MDSTFDPRFPSAFVSREARHGENVHIGVASHPSASTVAMSPVRSNPPSSSPDARSLRP
jgi:hypothetical protein